MANTVSVDTIVVVSSDPDVHLGIRSVVSGSFARSTMLFRAGEELIQFLHDGRAEGRCVVVVDTQVMDVAPLNLVDAVRSSAPDVDIVVALESADDGIVQRAMLAGAHAAVLRNCDPKDLQAAIERVVRARPDERQRRTAVAGSSPRIEAGGVVLSVVGARGGAGRSTVTALLGHLAAGAAIDTALLDLDLQFGDLGLLHGTNGSAGLTDLIPSDSVSAADVRRLGTQLAENLTLYSLGHGPGQVELVASRVGALLHSISAEHALVIVNTGAFWSLLHSELLSATDQVVCVLDQSLAGVRSTVLLLDLCSHLGVSTIGFEFVVNRCVPEGLSGADIARALNAEWIRTIPDGGYEARVGIDGGGIALLASGGSEIAAATQMVLDDVAARSGLPVAARAAGRGAARRGRRLVGWAR